jgi:hypothetical protein
MEAMMTNVIVTVRTRLLALPRKIRTTSIGDPRRAQ